MASGIRTMMKTTAIEEDFESGGVKVTNLKLEKHNKICYDNSIKIHRRLQYEKNLDHRR